MKIDENEFFRQATLRICGNLEIDKALFESMKFLRETMPVDRIHLQFVEEGLSSFRIMAIADEKECKTTDFVVPLTLEAQQELKQFMEKHPLEQRSSYVLLFDDPYKQLVNLDVFNSFYENVTSLMVLLLRAVKGKVLGGGSIWFSTRGENKFTQEDADMLSLLREPFSIAMSNAMKHRSELKLYEREFFWEATRRICGNLDIAEALFSTLRFLNKSMPATIMFLERYEENLTATRTIAKATLEKAENVDLLTPLSPAAQEFARGYITDNSRRIYLVTNLHEKPFASEMMRFHKISLSSLILMPLVTGGQVVGSLTIGSETDEKFKQEHADRILSLSEPFAVAMSNALKHRSELRLHDMEFFREATLRICGNLKIEEGLRACIEYISQHMPADVLYLHKYEKDLGLMRFVVRASIEKGEKIDMLIPLPEQAKTVREQWDKARYSGTLPPVIIINQPEENPVTRHVLNAIGEPLSSVLGLPLALGDKLVGSLLLLAKGNDRFDEYDARLFENLKVPFFVAMSNTLKHREIIQLKDLLADDNRYLHGELRRRSGDEIVGANFGLKGVMHKVQQVSTLNSPVLLLGETGVGKDVIANTIHYSSNRSDGPFVSVNCGAIPDTMIDAELFGHEKGAFTGALSQKRGRFERAENGTIFLDEIGELPPQAQVRLLRVLQSKEIERVGGDKTIQLNIRIIAATNRNLEEMVKKGTFRKDLWFRLNVFPVWIPPLRERSADIPALIQYFINVKGKELNMQIIPELATGAMEILMQYQWPGNVRELENIVERAIILNPAGPLKFDELIHSSSGPTPVVSDNPQELQKLDEVISKHIKTVLSNTDGRVHGSGGAADILGINSSTLRNRMNKLGIKYGRESQQK
jgi:transcriptional regulator with GAF, ATPase, and Fis domain